MKNYDPVSFTRDKWMDNKHTKNKPHSCNKAHTFCNFQYQWGKSSDNPQIPVNLPINPTFPNLSLPKPQDKIISINYDSITQENLDDWIAQSMNRNLGSMLNPQKKFHLPSHQYEKQIRRRYRKNQELKKVGDDQTYFATGKPRSKSKSYMSNERKKKLGQQDLFFDYRKLEPHHDMGGTPIKIKQMNNLKKKQIIRRNAVLLNNDVHYARFLKQQKKQRKQSNTTPPKQNQSTMLVPRKNMIYSFNLDSMKRVDQFEDVPNSIIEKQYERINGPSNDFLSSHRALMNKQEQLHEKYRQMMNEKTKQAINQIKETGNIHIDKSKKPYTVSSFHTKKKQISKQNTHQTRTQGKVKTSKNHTMQQKITQLLNDMQVQSEKIDPDMSKLCIHAKQICLQYPDSRPQTKWILKAQQKIKQGQNLLAIDCYKQALIIHPEEFIAVYNIAVLLQKQNMLDSASKWFEVAQQFKTDTDKVTFGYSVVKIKQKKFHQGLTAITQIITRLQNSQQQDRKLYVLSYYIRSLCYKQLRDFQMAKQDYRKIEKDLIPSNYHILPDFIFSIVFSKVRRISLSFNSLSYMLFKEAIFIILHENAKRIKQPAQKLQQIAEKLINQPFFKRFSLKLIKKFLSIATYQEFDKDQIIFSEREKTSIILNGLVSLKSHQNNIQRPSIVSVLARGGLIGTGQIQNYISWKPNNWFVALSKVQLITVPLSDFQMFWRGQITFQLDFKYNFLKNIKLFRGLSDVTLFKLCQLFKVVKYDKNSILFNDCSYRIQIINKAGTGYGLTKPTKKTDPRFVTSHSVASKSMTNQTKRNKGRSKIFSLIKKHIFKFNQMKFSRLKYPGLFIVKSGQIQIEDDKGFRCSGIITAGEFFGESLIIDNDGFHKYGRMVVQSQQAQVFLLELDDLVWLFSEEDKNIMLKNCQDRQSVETVSFLRNRHMQFLVSKFGCKRTGW